MIQYFLTIAALILATLSDLRHRSVYRSLILAYLLAAAAVHLILRDCTPLSVLAGLVPGLVFGLLALITGGELGFGDALIIFSCGFSLGFSRCLGVLMISFFLAGGFSALLLIFKKGTKKSAIPLIPFLLAGSIVQGVCLLAEQG